ncbi:peptidoglycan-binding domain-containing protein [Leifsonia poae]|uniref:peptidoglycan-binding domain-containing protein n=1 Tax=Leifsonia poae TaxID=110933 RepID=UPI003D678609
MKIESVTPLGCRTAAVVVVALALFGLAGCASGSTDVERAQAKVSSKEKAANEAKAAQAAAAETFCQASKTYITALDRYGDVLHDTAPTVGDVKKAGADLAEPRDDAFDGAEAAVTAQQDLVVAERELADARAELEQAKAGPSGVPSVTGTPQPTPTPLVPASTVDRVKKADAEFSEAQGSISDKTTLADASEQFNSAVVALEFSWLQLFSQAGCIPDAQKQQAAAAVSTYVTALQQDLAAAGYYSGNVDGVYGPQTVSAVEDLQKANGLPVTGAVDKATAAALQAKLSALGGAAAQEGVATTAAVQQTLNLVGFWDGPVDGVWTPALTEALKSFQTQLGVEPTGVVDAATISAFEKAVDDLKQPAAPSTPSPSPSS